VKKQVIRVFAVRNAFKILPLNATH